MLWSTSGCSAPRPDNLGLKNNLLLSCPKSPNCVLSQASDAKHKIKPIYYATSVEAAKEKLIKVIQSMDGTRIITQDEVYWQVEFTTRWLRFIDDVEFYFPESEALIHLRSASRSGYWDLGVNRKRVEEIRSRFEELAR
ncbi:MAG: DUF1499 domain-containing protein [SAR324 cluster bacterium]|uniref:DUF1499 domain-containing protein n=1 Tax=SAR324 cluster bacterium TaxID=2024889 RepID=A0A432GF62_9DELT|nr:MAG: DUF1499 domain-containing protein [SAR324 cluster bacterium]